MTEASLNCPDCGTDIQIQLDELQSGTVDCPDCGTTLRPFDQCTLIPSVAPTDTPITPSEQAARTSSASSTNTPPASSPCNTGSALVISGIDVGQIVGQGGMGVVYEGWQRSLQRKVAIKVLAPRFARSQEFVERFQNEARALAALDHSNIVRVIDQGQAGDHFYFIMDYVEGPEQGAPCDLRQSIDRGQLDLATARQWILQVTAALQFAHDQGIVHRDIKPGNIMIDRHGNAKVTDFGIAAMAGAGSNRVSTGGNALMGTFDYMAPEQRRDAGSVDHRADIYSTGVMLYEMLTGEVPDRGYTPPSQYITGLSDGWDAIVDRALAADREERFACMADMASMIEDLETTRQCQECGVSITGQPQFCASCGTSLWFDCPKCHTTMFVGDAFCTECGADVQLMQLYQHWMDMGQEYLRQARSENRLDEQLQWTGQAGLAFCKARRYQPDDPSAWSAQVEANRQTVELARQAAVVAEQEQRLSYAIEYYQQIVDIDPTDVVSGRLTEICAIRNAIVAEAYSQLEAGNAPQACKTIATAHKQFNGDPVVADCIERCEEQRVFVSDAVQHRIPTLVTEKRWCAVRDILLRLRDSNASVRGLDGFTEKLEAKLQRAEAGTRKAAAYLHRGDHAGATKAAREVLDMVADHADARQILDTASQGDAQFQQKLAEFRTAAKRRQWHRAGACMLLLEFDGVDQHSLEPYASQTEVGIRRLRAYFRLLIWTFVGWLPFTAAGLLAFMLGPGLGQIMPGQGVRETIFLDVAQATAGVIMLLILLKLLTRALPATTLFVSAVMVIGTSIVAGVLGPILLRELPDSAVAQTILTTLLLTVKCLAWGVALSCMVNIVLGKTPLAISWLAVLGIAAMVACAVLPMSMFSVHFRWVATATILTGLLATTGLVHWRRAFFVPILGLFAGSLEAGAATVDLTWYVDGAPLWSGAILAVGTHIVMTRPTSLDRTVAVFLVAIAVAITELSRGGVTHPPLLILATFWFALHGCLTIANRASLDFRLQWRDRKLLRQPA